MPRPRINVMIMTQGEPDKPVRSYSFPWYAPRAAIIIAAAVVALLLTTSVLFLYFFSESRDVPRLRKQVESMTGTVKKIDELQRELTYHRDFTKRIADLLGITTPAFEDSVRQDLEPTPQLAVLSVDTMDVLGSEEQDRDLPPPSGLLVTECPPDPNNRPRGIPLRGRISRGFAPHQGNPSLKHTGLDFAVREGTPVLATADGIVEFAGEHELYGFLIVIDHGNGFKTTYGHNSVILVKTDERVRRGDRIAFSGNTGVSTAPHLHYEITEHGEPVDPSGFFGR